MNKKDNKNKFQLIFYILIALVLLVGVSYAFFRANLTGDKEYSIEVGGLVFRYTEAAQGLTINNSMPVSDEEGIVSTNYFDFNIYAEDKTISYNIYLKELSGNTLDPDYVKVYLTDQTNTQIVAPTAISSLSAYVNDTNSYLLYTTSISPNGVAGSTQYYRLRIWLSNSYNTEANIDYTTNGNLQSGEVETKTFAFKINISPN